MNRTVIKLKTDAACNSHTHIFSLGNQKKSEDREV